jgi:fructose-bisphosphate aldolase class II
MLVSGRELLQRAVVERRAVGSFNTYNLEITRAILRAAEARNAPVFLAIGTGAFDYAGFEVLAAASLAAAHEAAVPVAVHLDHSPDVETVRRCVEAGLTSVMIDGSRLPLDENMALTRRAVEAAMGVCVEAELGGIAGAEDSSGTHEQGIPMTDPGDAARFLAETGVDSLAIAIGNAHGFYSGEPHLDFDRLRALEAAVPAPLVLHGASGISDTDLRRCVDLGVRKVNVNTEIRYALFQSLQASISRGVPGYDVTKLFGAAIEAMQQAVEEKLAVFGWE